MRCFYHPETESVGICQECGKSACRECVEDVGGAMLCKDCIRRIQAAHAQKTRERETERQMMLAGERARATKRLRWSYILALQRNRGTREPIYIMGRPLVVGQ